MQLEMQYVHDTGIGLLKNLERIGQKMFKSLLFKGRALLLASVLLSTTIIGIGSASASTAYTGMRNITSQQIVNEMKVGWNLGNSLDATGGETNWGNPATTKAMIDQIKAKGFNTVRIPVTWDGHMGGAPNYTIDTAWLNRVEQVVNYVLDNNMYVIINLHHDNAWIKPFYANETQTIAQLTKVWTQIANRFKPYSDYLIFETMNETRPIGTSTEWTGGTAENRDVVNKFNLAAVNAIRNTGGNNATRHLMIPTIAASASSVAINALTIPNNDSRIIVSVHMYSPYSFSMDQNATAAWGTAADKASLDAEFNAVYNKFVANGRAVVIGEMGTINKNNTSAREAHAQYFAQSAKAKGMTAIWWDNNYTTAWLSDTYGLFNRNTLTWTFPTIAQAFVNGAGGSSSASVLYNFESGLAGWTGYNVTGGPWTATDWSNNGNNSLKADISLANGAQYYLMGTTTQNLSGKTQLKAVVRHSTSGNQGTGMVAKLYIKAGSSYTWTDGGGVNINSSTAGTVLTLNLSGISNLNDVKEIGVQYIAAGNASGATSIYLDYVTVQ